MNIDSISADNQFNNWALLNKSINPKLHEILIKNINQH